VPRPRFSTEIPVKTPVNPPFTHSRIQGKPI
jgi:hypothetical protein